MDQITHTMRSSYWRDIILRCQNRPEGISAKQWMAENQIGEKSYYYWQRKFRKEAYAQMNTSTTERSALNEKQEIAFAEIPMPTTAAPSTEGITDMFKPAAAIKTATMMIALSNDISDNLLSRILKEVSHA